MPGGKFPGLMSNGVSRSPRSDVQGRGDLSHDTFNVTYPPKQTDALENITFPQLRLRTVITTPEIIMFSMDSVLFSTVNLAVVADVRFRQAGRFK